MSVPATRSDRLSSKPPITPTRGRDSYGDRAMPYGINAAFNLKDNLNVDMRQNLHCEALLSALNLGSNDPVFAYSPKQLREREVKPVRLLEDEANERPPKPKEKLVFPTAPTSIIDAPGLVVNASQKILDLHNFSLAAILGYRETSMIHILPDLSASNKAVESLPNAVQTCYKSIAWHDQPRLLTGTFESRVEKSFVALYDVTAKNETYFCALDEFNDINVLTPKGPHVFFAGGDEGEVAICDTRASIATVRIKPTVDFSLVTSIASKRDNIFAVGRRWCADIETGEIQNAIDIYDMRSPLFPICTYADSILMRGCAFNPVRPDILAAATGSSHTELKIIDVATGRLLQTFDTETSIFGLAWDHEGKFLYSNQGGPTNAINVFEFKNEKVFLKHAIIDAHGAPVVYCANSRPVDTLFVTAAGDECVKVWDMSAGRRQKQEAPRPTKLTLPHHR